MRARFGPTVRMDLLATLAAHPTTRRLAALARRDEPSRGAVLARGSVGSSTHLLAGAVARLTSRPVVLVVAHLDDAEEAADELGAAGAQTVRLPALEVLPGETSISLDLFAQRLAAVRRVLALGSEPGAAPVIIAPIQALMQAVPDPAALGLLSLTITRGERRPMADVVRWLDNAGYRRLDAVEEPGDYAVRGGILDVFPPGEVASSAGADGAATGAAPVRIDFFGDEVDRISEFDLETMASDRAVERVELVCASSEAAQPSENTPLVSFLDLVPREALAILHETLEVTEQARGYYERVTDARGIFGPPAVLKLLQERFAAFIELNQFSAPRAGADVVIDLPVSPLPPFTEDAQVAIAELGGLTRDHRVHVLCQNDGENTRLHELLAEFAAEHKDAVTSAVQYLHRGFVWHEADGTATALVPYHELLHRFQTRRRLRRDARLRAGRAMDTFLDFAPGDFVVHRDHGIAKFVGLVVMPPGGARLSASARLRSPTIVLPSEKPKKKATKKVADDEPLGEYLTLEFAGKAKLHVPAVNIDQVQKYVGGFHGAPKLSILGGERWQKQKEAVSASVRGLAAELLRVRAAREHLPGIRFPADTAWQKEFEAEFPYEETDDQLAALAEIKKDMQDSRPMDRLLCGDVGYGKTELAIRAAFKAVEFGKQVAVLVPTTVLAEQHERTFRSRFADYPFRVESLSRFKTQKEINDTLAAIRKGHVDVVIGTHRLLSKDVRFADLGLVIIDEEQRFGVEHKERLLSLRMTVDVLTLSATPIPRTLHMSMLGLRDISSLATPPMDRRAVVTEVIPYNERRIQQAIARELARGGQVYFVHNRIHNIETVADTVQRLAGERARVVWGHGQMPPKELEAVMLAFMRREADILVSTTIIESGIDIPTANTMFINDADRFGLAELHQLRGRVGRYKHRAYCYLLLPADRNIGEVATKRLKAIEEFSMLGAGFKIAMRDLEIRGAGNILGPEQSGHIAAVGYEMYCQLLDRSVKELKGEAVAVPSETAIELGVYGLLPKAYIPSDQRRMEAYRRLALAATPEEVRTFEAELTEAYGPPPPQARRLIDLAELRTAASRMEIRSITVRERDVVIRTRDPAAAQARLAGARGTLRLLPPKPGEEAAELYYRPPESYLEPSSLLAVLRKHLVSGSAGEEADADRSGSARPTPRDAPEPSVPAPYSPARDGPAARASRRS